ncbi:MAG: hypothetical protein GY952_21090 [Rhodobacteraceae bacterium]|nr:hypothetical protein [Paracoccaceae bacterium]
MKLAFLSFSAFAAMGFGLATASAQEEVTFRATPIQPSAFKVKKAKAKGIELEPTPGIELKGRQYLPDGAGPNPAVIILVSGDGLTQSHLNWAETLSEAGYVALVVDSFGARGGGNYQDTSALNMPDDAYSAFRYLAARTDVDVGRIGLLGFSLGGFHIFTVVSATNARVPDGFSPVSAIAVYPECQPDGAVTVPMMILAGDADQLMSLSTCRAFVQQTENSEHPVTLHVYPGVTHFFDNPAYTKGEGTSHEEPKPLWFEGNHYDKTAHADAVSRILEFLEAAHP